MSVTYREFVDELKVDVAQAVMELPLLPDFHMVSVKGRRADCTVRIANVVLFDDEMRRDAYRELVVPEMVSRRAEFVALVAFGRAVPDTLPESEFAVVLVVADRERSEVWWAPLERRERAFAVAGEWEGPDLDVALDGFDALVEALR